MQDKRGRLVTLNEMGIVLGFLLAYGIGYAFVNVKNGWLVLVGKEESYMSLRKCCCVFCPC